MAIMQMKDEKERANQGNTNDKKSEMTKSDVKSVAASMTQKLASEIKNIQKNIKVHEAIEANLQSQFQAKS
jgi:hypothetical protein